MTQVNGITLSPVTPSAPAMSPADHAAHQLASYTRPNPAAAALYTQAAADYDNAARDADKLGAHNRATTHRQRAAEHRALAVGYSGAGRLDLIGANA